VGSGVGGIGSGRCHVEGDGGGGVTPDRQLPGRGARGRRRVRGGKWGGGAERWGPATVQGARGVKGYSNRFKIFQT
jgi:hypothetical protein